MPNSEIKILLINGEAKIICSKHPSKSFKTKIADIFTFAETVTRKVKSKWPELMVEYILRADLFEVFDEETRTYNLKLNEFESFDADFLQERRSHYHRKRAKLWKNEDTGTFISTFWFDKIQSMIL